MTDETTTEQLAEIEGQATGYTPPERWRVLEVGEVLQLGDVWVNHEGESRPTKRVGERVNDERYIRRIEPQPEPVQVREGRWKTRAGDIRNVTATPEGDGRKYSFPWWDAQYRQTWTSGGRYYLNEANQRDLIEYLGPIEQQPVPVPQPNAAAIEELRSEVSYVQNLLGTERRRVTQLEELVTSLRTINEAQEKAFNAAGKANTDLQHRLNVVAAEWAEQAETIRRLQIELDAAQQVPQAIADRFEEGWNQGTARAVETIVEWTEPIRTCGSQRLAWVVMANLPQIMRHLTGLAQD